MYRTVLGVTNRKRSVSTHWTMNNLIRSNINWMFSNIIIQSFILRVTKLLENEVNVIRVRYDTELCFWRNFVFPQRSWKYSNVNKNTSLKWNCNIENEVLIIFEIYHSNESREFSWSISVSLFLVDELIDPRGSFSFPWIR